MSIKRQNGFMWVIGAMVTLLLAGVSMSAIAATSGTNVSTTQQAKVQTDEDVSATYNKDPLEKMNRAFFCFNENFDYYFMKPVAEVYKAIMPRPLYRGIHNAFVNLSETSTIINDVLQFNFYQSGQDLSRFLLNSTVGIGGLIDVAGWLGVPHFHNDFGLTMARWGYTDSSYLVLPFLGSNTIRDGIGIPVDYYGFTVYPYIEPQYTRYGVLALFFIDYRANALEFDPVLEEAAIDKYVFMRNAYMQRRAYQIEQVKHLSYNERNDKCTKCTVVNSKPVETFGPK